MKNYITVAALLAAGSACAYADVGTRAAGFFGGGERTAPFCAGTVHHQYAAAGGERFAALLGDQHDAVRPATL